MKQKEKNSRKKLSLSVKRVVLWMVIVFTLLSGYSLAKYIASEEEEPLYVAKSFYFESDMLMVSTGAVPQYTLQTGEKKISFSLMNYPDELRSSEVDINYTVVLTKEDGTEVDLTSGTIEKGRNSVQVLFNDLEAGTYVVTATANSPYTQTLQGKFTIVDTNYGLSYNVLDGEGSPNLKVTVTTTDYAGDILISWPEGVLPDNTDSKLVDAKGLSHTIEVNAQSEYTFQFFKTNPNEVYSNRVNVSKFNS